MLAPKLLQLAQLVGLPHYRIARQLGVDRSLVSHWARGKITVPVRHEATLKDLVATAVKDFWSRAEDMTLQEVQTGVPAEGSRRARVAGLAWECLVEDDEERGCGPTAMIPAIINVMAEYAKMEPAELRDAQKAAALDALAGRLKSWTTALCRLGTMEAVYDSSQRQPRLADPIVRRDSRTHATPDSVLAPARHRRIS